MRVGLEMKTCLIWAFTVAVLATCVEGWTFDVNPGAVPHNAYSRVFLSGSCQADPQTYSTSQTLLAEETVLIIQFSLSCSDEKDVR